MASASLGQKHQCSHCGTRFYDLNQQPATCPKCGTVAKMEQEVLPIEVEETTPQADDVAMELSQYQLEKDDEQEENSELPAGIDTIEAMEEDDDADIVSLSELDDRESGDEPHAAHNDDVEESQLMDEMEEFDTILDDAEEVDEELRA